MNILFIIPANRSYVVMPSLGLGYLASMVRRDNSVTILHCIRKGFNLNRFKKFLNRRSFDLISF